MLGIKSRLNMEGQSLVEYLVLLAVVVLGVIVGMTFFKNTIANTFNKTGNAMEDRVESEMTVIDSITQEEAP